MPAFEEETGTRAQEDDDNRSWKRNNNQPLFYAWIDASYSQTLAVDCVGQHLHLQTPVLPRGPGRLMATAPAAPEMGRTCPAQPYEDKLAALFPTIQATRISHIVQRFSILDFQSSTLRSPKTRVRTPVWELATLFLVFLSFGQEHFATACLLMCLLCFHLCTAGFCNLSP